MQEAKEVRAKNGGTPGKKREGLTCPGKGKSWGYRKEKVPKVLACRGKENAGVIGQSLQEKRRESKRPVVT